MDAVASLHLLSPGGMFLSFSWRNSIRSFPVGAEFSLCRVSGCTHDPPEYEVSYLEVSVSDPGVEMSGHAILVSSDPLLCRRPNLIYQVQL